MIGFIVCFSFISGVALAYLYFSRYGGRRKQEEYIVIYDGVAFDWQPCKRVEAGIKCQDGTVLPVTVLRRVQLNDKLSIYLSNVEAIPLAQQRAFELGRKGIVFASIFKGGGDIGSLLQTVATALVIAFLIYNFSYQSGISSLLVQQNAQLKTVSDVLSKPLMVAK